mgnify:CR=1 FL=1
MKKKQPMNQMRRAICLALVLLLLGSLFATGCTSRGDTPDTQVPSENPIPETTQAPTEEPAAEEPKLETVTDAPIAEASNVEPIAEASNVEPATEAPAPETK